MPTPEKSMSSIRKPTDGLGAPWYCSTSPMPRSWKKRGREVPAAQLRSGIRPSTSSKCWTPAPRSVSRPITVTLCGSSATLVDRRPAVTTISSRESAAETAGRAKRIEAVSAPNKSHGYFIHLLPTPVLTGSGSTGSPVHRRLRPIEATPRFKRPTISVYRSNSMPDELTNRSDQTAKDQNDGGQERESEPHPALRRLFHIRDGVDFPADQVDRSQHCCDERSRVMAEEIESGQKYDQLLQGILLDAKISFKSFVSGDGRRLHSVAPARATDSEPEHYELQ